MVASDACGCRHSDAISCPACKQCGSHHHLGTACRVGFCPRCERRRAIPGRTPEGVEYRVCFTCGYRYDVEGA